MAHVSINSVLYLKSPINAKKYSSGGQIAALRTSACGSLSFANNYIFVSYFLFLLQSVEIL